MPDSHAVPSDAVLVARLIAGDEHALEQLHERYHAELWRFAYGHLKSRDAAEDVVQDAFIAVWNRRTTLDAAQSIRAYLYGAVRNGVLMLLRSSKMHDGAETYLSIAASSWIESPDDNVETSELQHHLSRVLQQLTERQRSAVTLRWLRQMPYDEVAAIMGISRQAVDALLQRTYGVLRDALAPFKRN